MRSKIFCLATLFAMILAPSAVKADLGGFFGDGCYYVGALGGANWLTQSHRQCCFRPKYETGYGVGGFVGYKMCCYNFRGEVEVTYRRNEIEHRKHKRRRITPDILTGSDSRNRRRHKDRGHYEDISLMFNGFYDFDLCSCFTPYIGAGVGVDWTRFDNNRKRRRRDSGPVFEELVSGSSSSSGSSGSECHRRSRDRNRKRHHCRDKTRLGLQAIAGVSYNICDNIDVSVDYRYHWTERFFNNHLVALGLRYYF
jgi:opacity protein-like surface antigen